jgi:hypothetical protein
VEPGDRDVPGVDVRWQSSDQDGLLEHLRELGLEITREAPRIAFPSGDLEILPVNDATTAARTARDRLERNPGRNQRPPVAPPSPPGFDLIALGWATVDIERAASAFPGTTFAKAPPDELLGARAWLTEPTSATRIVLLEPATEGRLAAFLARNGEGPAALYLAVPPKPDGGIGRRPRASATPRGGPFGAELLVHASSREGPWLLVATGDTRPATE